MIRKIQRSGILYVLPAVAVVAVVMLYPLIYTAVMGFFKFTLMTKTPQYAGLSQYQAIFGDRFFSGSIGHTLVWTAGSVTLQFGIGFGMALLLHQPFVRGKTVLRIFLMVPWVLPSIIGSATWKWMYNADYGLINYVFKTLGIIPQYQTWLSSVDRAMPSIIAVNVWKMFPYVMLMIEAALQGVSKDLKEAATIDGAGSWHIFANVTLPAIAGQCYSVLLLLIVWTLNSFTFVYNLTDGGPSHATEVMAMFIYKKAFTDFDFGKACAASMVLFILCMMVAAIYMRVTKEDDGR